jgi:hypothetical protein
MATIPPEALYLQLGQLLTAMPDLTAKGPISGGTNRWLAVAFALVEAVGHTGDAVAMKLLANRAGTSMALQGDPQQAAAIVNRALVRAEMAAPAAMQGAFIPAGGFFDAFAALKTVISEAKADVLLVDPYAGATILTDYAEPLVADGVRIRVLAAVGKVDASMKVAAQSWTKTYATRSLEVRLAKPKLLHDRAIITDGKTAWTMGQSFNGLGKGAFTTIIKSPPEVGSEKIAAYDAIWDAATRFK